MSKYILVFIIVTDFLLVSCRKTLSTGDTSFDVMVEKTILSTADTARFSFTGNPDIITFYSGEIGKRFEYRNRTSADGTPFLRFRTIRANGSQPNSLQLMVSSDFAGVVQGDTVSTISNIRSAAWTDITSRATLSSGATTAVSSGNVDLSDFKEQGKTVFIAFRYNGAAGSVQNKWTIDSFSVKNALADGSVYEIANQSTYNVPYTNYGVSTFSPGFVTYRLSNSYYWSFSTTSLAITGATTALSAAPAESWIIIGAVDLKKVTPDAGRQIKNGTQKIEDAALSYKYSSAGNYNVVFAGGRISKRDSVVSTKSFQIVVK